MRIETYGTAFTSYDVKANKQTKEQLSNEKISFNDDIQKTNEIKNISYHTAIKTGKPTVFKDPTNDKYVIVSLNDKIIEKLKTKFDEDNFIEKEDGSIRLTGEAEAFVSGWFADIAYKREFLESDKNQDGKISEDEYKKVKNSYISEANSLIQVDGTSERIAYFGEKITQQYVTVDKDDITYRQHQNSENLPSSLDDELNMTLKLDKNFDGIMTLEESYSETNESLINIVMADLKSIGETAEPLEDSQMNILDLSLIDAFDKFVQLDDKERLEYLKKHLEAIALKNKEKKDEMIELKIEEAVALMFEQQYIQEQKDKKELNVEIYV